MHPGSVLKSTYRVDRPLAAGGMCRIFIGNPLRGAGLVAIKELAPSADPAEARDDVKQFRTEYDILSTLTHPSLPMALDFFEEGGRHYLVEEYIPGETLQAMLLREGRLPAERAVRIALQILEVLEYLHHRRIVYRDLKPQNVMLLRGGRVRLIDFGAARRYRKGARQDTVPLGTPGYASPEHYGKAQTDARSDVWSLGAVMHYMLSGTDPSDGTPWRFEPLGEDVPEGIAGIVSRALEMDPARRYQTAKSMRLALTYPSGERPKPRPRLPGLTPPSLIPAALMGPSPPPGADDEDQGPPPPGFQRRIRRIRYDDPFHYVLRAPSHVQGVLALAAMGSVLASRAVPQVLAPLLLTAVLGLLLYSHVQWYAFRGVIGEVWEGGLRIRVDGSWHQYPWSEVASLRVMTRPDVGEVATTTSQFLIPGDWPGFQDMVSEIVHHAGLEETPRFGNGIPSGEVIQAYERIA